MKKIIAAELEDGDVVELRGSIEGKGYQGEYGQDVCVEEEFEAQGVGC